MTIDRARKVISDALAGARSPIVCWSGGKDSQLLLRLVAEQRPNVPVLYFRSADPSRRRWAEQFIADSDLTAYSWNPADRYVLPGPHLVEEYSFGDLRLPIVSDVVDGERCVLEIPRDFVTHVAYPFDVTFVGVKDSDEHPVLGNGYWQTDGDGCFAPLRTMSDEEVWQAIREMEIPVEESVYNGSEPDGPSFCTRCLSDQAEVFCPAAGKVIPRFDWNPSAALSAFHQRFRLEAS
jgi:hypothetical protein